MHAWKLFAGLVMVVMVGAPPAAKADDDTTASYIAECSADPHSCQASIGMGVVMGLSGGCVPDSMQVPSDDQVLQVIDWLKAHPDVHPDDWAEAVDAALAAMYPCSN